MIKIKEAVIVEGKYDKIKLSSILDTFIMSTEGFSVFKNKEKMSLIRKLAESRGVLILTDSDAAGFKIRSYIGGSLPKEQVKHVYIPDVFGKERRKTSFSVEGKLGVEGMDTDVIIKALKQAGVETLQFSQNEQTSEHKTVSITDFFEAGLSGKADSKQKRLKLLKQLDLPERLSTSSLIEVLNSVMNYEQIIELLRNSGGSL